jgi:hypothetical protein
MNSRKLPVACVRKGASAMLLGVGLDPHTWPSVEHYHGYSIRFLGEESRKMDIVFCFVVVDNMRFEVGKGVETAFGLGPVESRSGQPRANSSTSLSSFEALDLPVKFHPLLFHVLQPSPIKSILAILQRVLVRRYCNLRILDQRFQFFQDVLWSFELERFYSIIGGLRKIGERHSVMMSRVRSDSRKNWGTRKHKERFIYARPRIFGLSEQGCLLIKQL